MSLTAVSLLLATVAVFGALILAVAMASRAKLAPALVPVRARHGRRPRS